jgi:hypothetical protein
LVADKQLAKEIQYDMKQFSQKQKNQRKSLGAFNSPAPRNVAATPSKAIHKILSSLNDFIYDIRAHQLPIE